MADAERLLSALRHVSRGLRVPVSFAQFTISSQGPDAMIYRSLSLVTESDEPFYAEYFRFLLVYVPDCVWFLSLS